MGSWCEIGCPPVGIGQSTISMIRFSLGRGAADPNTQCHLAVLFIESAARMIKYVSEMGIPLVYSPVYDVT